jgi:hypothetical protein
MHGRNDPNQDMLQLVYSWLSGNIDRQWVMGLDGVDDFEYLFGTQEGSMSVRKKPLSAYLPHSPNGSIPITARSRDVGVQFTDRQRDVIEIGPMDPKVSLTLFDRRLGGRRSYIKKRWTGASRGS